MKVIGSKAYEMKIAYLGGGSRGWAWGLMADLAQSKDMSGKVYLYDIDKQAALNNEFIGNQISVQHPECDNFTYKATDTMEEALKDADFVIISILPGTFDEMESDVHAPEKYGIYQSVGDTVGPGGIIRALRTIPMFEEFANAIRKYCPNAWVINYTNPMTVCVRTLYKVFPQIKAFGCCHEVFGTQMFLAEILKEYGYGDVAHKDISVNVVGINHFTWLTKAQYKDVDIFPLYREFCATHKSVKKADENWMNKSFIGHEMVKMDLFKRYGAIAAAGDRHLAEFCPGKWYLKDPETVESWGFGLTSVQWRKDDLKYRLQKSENYLKGYEFKLNATGEEGALQMRAIIGLGDIVTNVNLPNCGQIPNLPMNAVVETNAHFTAGRVCPVTAGNIPENVLTLVAPQVAIQECVVEAGLERDLEKAFDAFMRDPLVTLDLKDGRALFDEMVKNTSAYLTDYLK